MTYLSLSEHELANENSHRGQYCPKDTKGALNNRIGKGIKRGFANLHSTTNGVRLRRRVNVVRHFAKRVLIGSQGAPTKNDSAPPTNT